MAGPRRGSGRGSLFDSRSDRRGPGIETLHPGVIADAGMAPRSPLTEQELALALARQTQVSGLILALVGCAMVALLEL